MRKGLMGLFVAALCLAGILGIGVVYVFLTLPDVRKLQGCLTTELFNVHLCKTDPGYTPYDRINRHIIDALIMSEDASFYSHQGVDFNEMKESLIRDWNEKRFARGASTITQQMVKNVFLSKTKSLLRKAEEIYLALQVEKTFNKKQILTFYLNVVEFGPEIYGVKAACKYYFNKAPSDVTPEQAAFLVFLLPNPKKYSQSFRKGQLTVFASKTIKTILHRMLKSHRLTDSEYTLADANVGPDLWHGAIPKIDTSTVNLESPTGLVDDSQNEANQEDDDFKFEFNADTPEE